VMLLINSWMHNAVAVSSH